MTFGLTLGDLQMFCIAFGFVKECDGSVFLIQFKHCVL